MSPQITVADVLEPYDERLGDASEPIILTLTEGNGFIPQQERFNKRLATEDTSDYKVIRRGDYAFNPYLLWAGAIACNRTHDVGIISPAYPTFRVRGGYEAAYVERLFSSEAMKVRYDLISFGAVPRRRRAKTEDFLAISLPSLPPLPEQKRIAAILDAADALRAKRRESIEQLDSLIQATFLEMFGDPVANPKGWAMTPLKDLAVNILSGTTPKGGEEVYVKGGVMFLRSQNVWKNRLELTDIAYIDSGTHQRMRKSKLQHKDILITKTGRVNTEQSSLGRAAMFLGDDGSANINGHVYLIRLRKGSVHEFVLRILTTTAYRDYIRSVCVGGIDKRQLNKSHIEQFPIIAPPIDLQTRFASIVESIEHQKTRLKSHLAELDALFSSLQSRAFNAELVA